MSQRSCITCDYYPECHEEPMPETVTIWLAESVVGALSLDQTAKERGVENGRSRRVGKGRQHEVKGPRARVERLAADLDDLASGLLCDGLVPEERSAVMRAAATGAKRIRAALAKWGAR